MPLTTLTHSELAASGISRFLHALGKARRCAGPGRAHLQTAGCLEPANTLRVPRGSGDVCLDRSAPRCRQNAASVQKLCSVSATSLCRARSWGSDETPLTNLSPVATAALAYLLFWPLIRVAAAGGARRAGAQRSLLPEATSRPQRPALSPPLRACIVETRPSPPRGARTRPGSQAPPTPLGAWLSFLPPALETQKNLGKSCSLHGRRAGCRLAASGSAATRSPKDPGGCLGARPEEAARRPRRTSRLAR